MIAFWEVFLDYNCVRQVWEDLFSEHSWSRQTTRSHLEDFSIGYFGDDCVSMC